LASSQDLKEKVAGTFFYLLDRKMCLSPFPSAHGQRLKLAEAAIPVVFASTSLQAAPAI
jgi:hypothetical protein